MVTVKISEKGGKQSNYEFNKQEVTIGRMKGNDIVLPKGNVSKKHARIVGRNGTLLVDDLNSTNGTYVNGRKVSSEQEIAPSDKIYIGDFILQVEPGAENQPPKAPPSPPGGQAQQTSGQSEMPPSPPSGGGNALDDRYNRATEHNPPVDGKQKRGRSQSRNRPAASGPQPRATGESPAVEGTGSHGAEAVAQQPSRSSSESSGGSPRPANPRRNSSSQPSVDPRPSSGPQPLEDSSPAPDAHDGRSSSSGPSSSASSAPARPPSPDSSPSRQRQARRPESDRQEDRSDGHAPGARRGYAVPATPKFRSEFDDDFQADREEAAQVLFDEILTDELPIEYPPMEGDRDVFRQDVEDAVDEINPRVDRDALVEAIVTECVGLGPLEDYLDDERARDVYVNRFDRIIIKRKGQPVIAGEAFSDPRFLEVAAERLLGTRDQSIGTDEVRFSDGTRVHVVMPPLAPHGPAITVRKPPRHHWGLEDLVDQDVLSEGMAEFLRQSVHAGRSILVAGPTSSGKTTLLGALGAEIADGTRIVSIEETNSLQLPQETAVQLETDPAAGRDAKYLLDTAMGMHPQRVVLDECRGAEAYGWVSSAAGGTEGSMLTIHAADALDALGRLESLALLDGADLSPRGLREQIARAVDLVVTLNRSPNDGFRVQQITEVQGVDLDTFRLNDVFYFRTEGTSGAFHPTGYIPLFYEDLRQMGVEVDLDIFRE